MIHPSCRRDALEPASVADPGHASSLPAGLFVGIISPLQQLFYSSRVGDEDVAPLAFMAAGLNILGGAAIPSTMLVCFSKLSPNFKV